MCCSWLLCIIIIVTSWEFFRPTFADGILPKFEWLFKSPELFSVFWAILIMQEFRWSQYVLWFLSLLLCLPNLWGSFQVHINFLHNFFIKSYSVIAINVCSIKFANKSSFIKSGLLSQQSLQYADYIPCRVITHTPKKRGVLNMTLNCIWWWGSCSVRTSLVVHVKIPSMGQINV